MADRSKPPTITIISFQNGIEQAFSDDTEALEAIMEFPDIIENVRRIDSFGKLADLLKMGGYPAHTASIQEVKS